MPITGITVEADSVVVKGGDFDSLCAAADENFRLRKELSLAEEGLANYAQEVERLTKERDKYKEVLRICSREAERQLREEVERLKEDIKEMTCGDPRKVCPNCGPSSGHPKGDGT